MLTPGGHVHFSSGNHFFSFLVATIGPSLPCQFSGSPCFTCKECNGTLKLYNYTWAKQNNVQHVVKCVVIISQRQHEKCQQCDAIKVIEDVIWDMADVGSLNGRLEVTVA